MSNHTLDTVSPIPAIYITIELIVGLLAIIGNSLVIIVFIKYENLRTTTNYYVMSLAVADLLVGTFGIPFAIATSLGYPTNFQACLFMNSLLLLLCTGSIFSLVAVSIDRFWAIQWPLTYPSRMTHRLAVCLITISWCLAAFVGMLPSMGWNKGVPDTPGCYFMQVIDMHYLATLYFTTILLPSAVMAIVYCFIFKAVKEQVAHISHQMLHAENVTLKKKFLNKQTKAAKSVAIVIILFVISWMPLYTFNTIICFCPHCAYPASLVNILIVLSHLNSAWNPALYAWGMRDWRHALLRLCGRKHFGKQNFTSDYSPENNGQRNTSDKMSMASFSSNKYTSAVTTRLLV